MIARPGSLPPAMAASGIACAAGAMVSIQVAGALSRPLVEEVGVAGVTWLRMAVAALLMLACVAVLAPILPCAPEMAALRKLPVQSFGILMSMEPAIAVLLGFLILHETPGQGQLMGVACVVLASAGAVFLPQRQAKPKLGSDAGPPLGGLKQVTADA